MQIKTIALYNRNGEIRTLPFELGKVNIITGRSSRGKSAIIEIVEYCLGRSTFGVPEGIIRDTVAWYCLLLQVKDVQVLVAKSAPQGSASSQSQVYLEVGNGLDFPDIEELAPNTNDDGLVDFLSGLIGIGPNRHSPDTSESRQPLTATIKHSEFYLFQPQSIVANRDILFHRQQEPFIPQAIKDTLPFFLGVVQENRLQLETDLRNARRNLRMLQRQLQEAEQIAGDNITQGQSLLAEAQQIGLVADGVNNDEWESVIATLRTTENWTPSSEVDVPNEQLLNLQDQVVVLRQRFRDKHEEIRSTENYVRQTSAYTNEAMQQQLRLQSIGIFDPDAEIVSCPLCSSELTDNIPKVHAIRRSLIRLEGNVTIVHNKQPKIQGHLDDLYSQREALREDIVRTEASISALLLEQEAAQRIRITNARIARVVGRISLYLENVEQIDDNADLQSRIDEQRRIVQSIEEALDSDEYEERLSSLLNLINKQMGTWAKHLELEHSEYAYRLDVKRLTVVADRPDRPIPMFRMGGGENWLGCHLIALLSLHRHFVNQARPVPNFLILDQPTQVYFPSQDIYKATSGENERELIDADADIVAVERMFELLFDVCEDLFPNFQIIVLEHANLSNERFQSALVEPPWNDERALVPDGWIADAPDD